MTGYDVHHSVQVLVHGSSPSSSLQTTCPSTSVTFISAISSAHSQRLVVRCHAVEKAVGNLCSKSHTLSYHDC